MVELGLGMYDEGPELQPGGYNEISSIFADQKRPRNTSPRLPMRGMGGVAESQPMSTAVHIT